MEIALALIQVVEPPGVSARVPAAVQRARLLLWDTCRSVLEEVGGRPVDSDCIGLLTVFDDVPTATRFGLQLHEALLSTSWPPTLALQAPEGSGSLSARVGVHVGPSEPDKVWDGPAVHQAARITSCAHGGQVLLSRAAYDRLGPAAAELEVCDLGGHRLAGIHGLVHLFGAGPRAGDHPPLQTLDHLRTNVLARKTTFFGREGDLAALGELHDFGVRLVTITGPEGVGKSRLARRYALLSREGDRYRDADRGGGLWYCDLAGAKHLDELVWAVGSSLNIPLTMGRDIESSVAQLGHALAARGKVLLVLDGIDGLREVAEPVLGGWLQQAPECRVLCTARKRLGLRGEVAYDLATFDVQELDRNSDAMRLFEARAKADNPSFQLDVDKAKELLPRLLGNPMVIELATACLPVTGSQGLLELVPDTGLRQLIRALGEGCWAQLDEGQRHVLKQCAVFPGAFGAADAEAVVAPRSQLVVREALQRLVDRGLVRTRELAGVPGVRRYTLRRRIRDWVTMRTPKPERAELKRRYAGVMLERCEPWAEHSWMRDGTEALARIAVEWSGLLSVQSWGLTSEDPREVDLGIRAVLVLEPLLAARGPFATHHALQDAALEASNRVLESDPLLQVRVLQARAQTRSKHGESERAVQELERARAIAERWSDARGLAITRFELARQRWDDATADELKAVATAFDELPDRRRSGVAIGTLGVLHMEQGRLEDAVEHFHLALAVFEEIGAHHLRGVYSGNLAVAQRRLGRTDDARALYRQSIRIHKETGDRRHEGIMTSNLGVLDYHLGRLDEAAERYGDAVTLSREVGHQAGEAVCLGNLGLVRIEQEQLDVARTLLLQALAMHRALGERGGEGAVTGYLGLLHHRSGQVMAARDYYGRAVRLLDEAGQRRFQTLFMSWMGALEADAGDVDTAQTLFDLAKLALPSLGDPAMEDAVQILERCLELAKARAEGDIAEQTARDAMAALLAEREQSPAGSGDLRLALAQLRRTLA